MCPPNCLRFASIVERGGSVVQGRSDRLDDEECKADPPPDVEGDDQADMDSRFSSPSRGSRMDGCGDPGNGGRPDAAADLDEPAGPHGLHVGGVRS